MADRIEQLSDNGLTFDDTFDSKLRNEIYVLTAGGLGAFRELKSAVKDVSKHPDTAAVEVATAAMIGAGLGFMAQRAGFWGVTARGVAGAMGVSFAFEGLRPWADAIGRAWNATSSYDIDRAVGNLSRSTGRILFDTMLTAPFAVGGAFAGRGLRSALSSEAAAATAKATVAEAARPQFSSAGAGQRVFAEGMRPRATRPETFTRQPEVLVGEIIDAPPRRTTARDTRPKVEIIDAEFTVVEVPGHGASLPAIRQASDAPVVIAHQPNLNRFTVMINEGTPLTLERALTQLRRFEPTWTIDGGSLVSPVRSQMTPEQVARALKAYRQATTPEPGSIVNVRA